MILLVITAEILSDTRNNEIMSQIDKLENSLDLFDFEICKSKLGKKIKTNISED